MNAHPPRAWLDAGPMIGDDPIDDVPDTAYALALRILAEHRASIADPRAFPPTAIYCGANSDRQAVGRPGHCSVCAIIGHVAAHPELGCCDVRCTSIHDTKRKRRPMIIRQGSGEPVRQSAPVRSPGEPPTGVPDDAYFGLDRTTGSPYAAYRFGTVVVETLGAEPVRFADAGDTRFARARFANATCDQEGAGAPVAGDLVEVYTSTKPVEVVTVTTEAGGAFTLTVRGRRNPIHLHAGEFSIIARPARLPRRG
jgi:hypothetical protein